MGTERAARRVPVGEMANSDGRGRSSAETAGKAASDDDSETAPDVRDRPPDGPPVAIDIDAALGELARNAPDPETALRVLNEYVELKRRYDNLELETAQKRGELEIALKEKDPDEIEKRRHSANRRRMAWAIAACVPLCLLGATGLAVAGASLFAVITLAAAGVCALVMLGPLASGGSVRLNEMAGVVQAFGGLVRGSGPEDGGRNGRRR